LANIFAGEPKKYANSLKTEHFGTFSAYLYRSLLIAEPRNLFLKKLFATFIKSLHSQMGLDGLFCLTEQLAALGLTQYPAPVGYNNTSCHPATERTKAHKPPSLRRPILLL
jgi:hypothetical protein